MNKLGDKDVAQSGNSEVTENAALIQEAVLTRKNKREQEPVSERETLLRVQKGDKQAYGRIVKKYMRSAYFLALGFVHNHEDALDASQDAFVKAFRKIKTFDANRPFFPWFYRILKNLCLDRLRRVRRRKEIPLEGARVLASPEEDRDLKRAVWRGIEQLPLLEKEIIILRYFHQLSYAEIAECIQRPVGTVMSSLYYAKKKLKTTIGKFLGLGETPKPE